MPLLLNPEVGATVLLYTEVSSLGSRSGAWATKWTEEFAGPEVAQFAICHLPEDDAVHLLGLSDDGYVVFDSEHDSQDEAKAYAESEYPAIAGTWLESK